MSVIDRLKAWIASLMGIDTMVVGEELLARIAALPCEDLKADIQVPPYIARTGVGCTVLGKQWRPGLGSDDYSDLFRKVRDYAQTRLI